MRDTFLTMITHPREPEYFSQTMKNLVRGGLCESNRLLSFRINETSEPANINVANALSDLPIGTKWVIFIEDDIDVCDNFVDSCAKWLDDLYTPGIPIYSFGSNHPEIQLRSDEGFKYWPYPRDCFFGTQCIGIPAQLSEGIAEYLREHCYDRTDDGTAYDLLMADWVAKNYSDCLHFLASCPAFVQHIGTESIVRPRPNVHTFPTFPGHEWSYV